MNVKQAILDALTVVCAVLYFWLLFVICLVAEAIARRDQEDFQQSAGCDENWPTSDGH